MDNPPAAKQIRLIRKHVGHTVWIRFDFERTGPQTLSGKIVKVCRGIAKVEYYIPGLFTVEPFVAYLPVRDARILEVI